MRQARHLDAPDLPTLAPGVTLLDTDGEASAEPNLMHSPHGRPSMRVRHTLKSNFLAGLVLTGPIIVTLFIIKVAMDWILGTLTPVVRGTGAETLTGGDLLLAQLLVAVSLVVLITVVGFVTQYSVGRRLFGRTGRTADFIPVFRTIYTSVKQVATSVTNRKHDYEEVVFVEYPREEMYSLGLVTGESPEAARDLAGGDVQFVFFPASPNPTQGKLLMVPEEHIHETGISVRRGLQLLMTTGMAEEKPVIQLDEEEFGEDQDGGVTS